MLHPTRLNIALLAACSILTAMLSGVSPAFAAYPALSAADGRAIIVAHKVRFENGTVQLGLQVLAPGKTIEAIRIDNLGGVPSHWRSDGRDGAAPLSVSQGDASLSLGSMPMIFNPGNTEALLSLSFKDNGAFAGKNTDFRVTVFFTGGERAMYALGAGDFPATTPAQVVQAASSVTSVATPTPAPVAQVTAAAAPTPTVQEAPAPVVPSPVPVVAPTQTVQEAFASAAQVGEQAAATATIFKKLLSLLLIISKIVIVITLSLGAAFFIRKYLLAKTAKLLSQAADGDAKAQFDVFNMYKKKQDKLDEAMQFLSQSAEQGYAKAQFELGVRCQTGNGIEKHPAQAVDWFTKAAEQGLVDAQYYLALCYQIGDGVDKDLDKAVSCFEKSAEQGHSDSQLKVTECKAELGDAESMYELATIFFSGSGGIKNNETSAIAWLSRAAENGHAKAQEELGMRYLQGNGIQKDPSKAARWLAEQGSAAVQYDLGLCYQTGDGVEKNLDKALDFFEKSAAQGHLESKVKVTECKAGLGDAEAMYELATIFCSGCDAIQQDEKLALNWLYKAAENGYAKAQYEFGMRYLQGDGVEKNSSQAVDWFKKSSDQGLADAQYNLALCYKTGDGVNEDQNKAMDFFEKSAAQGHLESKLNVLEFKSEHGDVESMYEFGIMMLNGNGIAKDEKSAMHWLGIAGKQGHEKAQKSFILFHTELKNKAVEMAERCGKNYDEFIDRFKLYQEWHRRAGSAGSSSSYAKEIWDELQRKYGTTPNQAVLDHNLLPPPSRTIDVDMLVISDDTRRLVVEQFQKLDSAYDDFYRIQEEMRISQMLARARR